jgi:TPR repeat protein
MFVSIKYGQREDPRLVSNAHNYGSFWCLPGLWEVINIEQTRQDTGPVPAYPLSHMQLTDPAMSSALRNLSRYEIVGLRRRAMYGDDSAALLLGMAYETGYLVSQNCMNAGEWITQSANEGNAAAQYNLGLRYRQGDGEPVNREVAVTWLRKAAAQKYSPAQLALESVP